MGGEQYVCVLGVIECMWSVCVHVLRAEGARRAGGRE